MEQNISTLSRLQELLPQLFQSSQLPGNSYLRCKLIPEMSVLLSMEYVWESLLVSGEQITAIPNMSPSVVGLLNSRDRVFCVINLAQLLGLSSPSIQSRQYHVVIVRVSQLLIQQSNSEQELLLGLIVNQIQGISRVMTEQLHLVNNVTKEKWTQKDFFDTITPYIKEYVIEKGQNLPVLDLKTIVNIPNLYSSTAIK